MTLAGVLGFAVLLAFLSDSGGRLASYLASDLAFFFWSSLDLSALLDFLLSLAASSLFPRSVRP